MIQSVAAFIREEDGNAVEYAMVAALIGLALVATFNTFVGSITTAFGTIGTNLNTAVQ